MSRASGARGEETGTAPAAGETAAGRRCGTCSVCCTAMRVAALNKPAGEPCVHQTEAGCGNYEHRPEVCRVWDCLWIRDTIGLFAERHRPDRLGVFFSPSKPDPRTGQQKLYAHQVRAGAVLEPEARGVIERLRRFAEVEVLPYRRPRGHRGQPAQLTHNGRAVEGVS